ncbi:hypothetical protein Ahy_A08g037910 [Arachis hypogaea]|uniref:Zinc finger PMZ-type domain-containing protein n=1 Tax=Arachis hypogaea TaxID=3818 RepID=A0A445BS39_ARAHY|nr:hypothetical protein Ahy_A08g037910 [Arachis hypogaea]
MPCIHALAAIRKRRDQPQDYVHPWLCMESIRRTYAHCIQPEPSHSQPPSSTPQQQQPTVPSGAGPTATNVAPAPTRVTRSTIVLGPPAPTGSSVRPSTPNLNQPFIPPGNAPCMVTSIACPKQLKFKPKQKIFRPPAPLAQGPPPSSTQHQEAVYQAPSSTQAAAQPQQAPPPQADKPTVSASKESNK